MDGIDHGQTDTRTTTGAQLHCISRSGPNLCCEDPIASIRTARGSPHHDGCYHVPRTGATAVTAPGTVGKAKREHRLRLPSLHLETVHRARIIADLRRDSKWSWVRYGVLNILLSCLHLF